MNETPARSSADGRSLSYVVLAAVLWGTVGITTQALYQTTDTNPLSIGFFRMGLGTPVLAILCWRALGRDALRIARRDVLTMLLAGAALGLSQVCYFTAIAYSGVAIATLITLCTAQVLVTLMSATIARERILPVTFVALACALAGTWLLVGWQPGSNLTGNAAVGALFALGSSIGYSVFTVASRGLAQKYHPLQSITASFAAGSLLLLILALASEGGLVVRYPLEGWSMLVYLGIVPSALGYSLFLAGMRSISATLASVTALIEPLTATLLARLVLGETLAPPGLAGAVLLLGAITLMYRAETRLRTT